MYVTAVGEEGGGGVSGGQVRSGGEFGEQVSGGRLRKMRIWLNAHTKLCK